MKRDIKILTEIGKFLPAPAPAAGAGPLKKRTVPPRASSFFLAGAGDKNKPLLPLRQCTGNEGCEQRIKNIENELSRGVKNNKFPLSIYSNHHYPFASSSKAKGANGLIGNKKGSLLNQKTYDYLNSVSPLDFSSFICEAASKGSLRADATNLKGFIPSSPTLGQEQKEVSIKTSLNDVIYQYLKTFSIFNKRKNGILIKYNQHIGYNFNSQNILLRGVEPQTNKNITNHYHPYHNSHYLDNGLDNGLNGLNRALTVQKKEPKINTVTANITRAPRCSRIGGSSGSGKELNRLKGVSGLTGYNRSANNRLIKYSYKLLFYFFKSMYCLISKPVFLFTPEKVTIQLFYYLNIPKFKVFKWYSILNNKLIRQKWYSLKKNLARARCYPRCGSIGGSGSNLSNLNGAEEARERNKLKTVLSISNKEMMNKVKLSWRIKKTLFRLNKKRSKVKNTLFNLYKFNLFKVYSLKFKLICEILSNKFKKPVELQLIRIHHPFHDSNILVNLLSLNIRNKKFKTNVAIEKLYAKKAVKNLYDYSINSVNFIPAFLSGIKIRIGGRLMREPIIPRITTKNFDRGASSPGKVNFLDTATITKKNRKGSYTIKISSGQNFF